MKKYVWDTPKATLFKNDPCGCKLCQKIQKEDRLRREFLETHFHQTGENPLLYHLIINLSKVSQEKAQDMILQLIEKNNELA